MSRKAIKKMLVLIAAVAVMSASEAQATAILTPGNNPVAGDENVLLNTGAIGDPIFGLTNQTQLQVRFDGIETLVAPANGQARIEAADGTLTTLTIDIPTGSFTSLILNLDASITGTVSFATDMTGSDPTQFFNNVAVGGSGSNFFTFTTINGERYESIRFTATTPVSLSFSDAAQFRMGGAQLTSVPDGGMTLSLLGGTLVALGMLRRKFHV